MDLKRADVREHWERMKPLIERCLAGHTERPEDIYAAVLYEKAALYVCDDGFIVLSPLPRNGGKQRMEVTCIGRWGESGAVERYLPEVESMAREAGAAALTCRIRISKVGDLLDERWKFMFAEYELEL